MMPLAGHRAPRGGVLEDFLVRLGLISGMPQPVSDNEPNHPADGFRPRFSTQEPARNSGLVVESEEP
jgi:hypothetical protein